MYVTVILCIIQLLISIMDYKLCYKIKVLEFRHK